MVAQRLQRMVSHALAEVVAQIRLLDDLDEANDYLQENPIDVLFLDLNLHGHDGFQLLQEKTAEAFHTIVVSANSDRAIEAFDIGVLDFVAKPFTQARITKAVKRLLVRTTGRASKLSYKQGGTLQLLAIEDIAFLRADGHYCEINTHVGRQILHDKPIDKLLDILPAHFVRIHRSYALSLSVLQGIVVEEGSRYWAQLADGHRLPIGRTRIKAVRQLWQQNQLGQSM